METNIGEIWKDVPDYIGRYKVSNLGRVKNHIRDKLRVCYIDRHGYARISYPNTITKKMTYFKVHRMVATLFVENPNNKPFVNHINGIKSDNRACNLEWCTNQENMDHAYAMNLVQAAKGDSWKPKLKQYEVLEIKKALEIGLSQITLASKYNVRIQTISRIKLGYSWKHLL